MTAVLSPMIENLWARIHAAVPAAEFGGSLPGPGSGVHSYHQCWADVPKDGGYTVHYYGDRLRLLQPNAGRYASALDVTLPPELMARYTARLHRLAVSHRAAFAGYGLREFAGTLDGKEVFAWDLTSGQRTYGWDDSHLWHIHLSINRRFANSKRIMRIADVFTD